MKTRAATLVAPHREWEIVELELEAPHTGEVLVRWEYGGLCFSDLHGRGGAYGNHFPNVCGHEGAGVVEEVGPGVTRLRPDDHVVASWIPVCGRCRWCSTGHSVMCEAPSATATGTLPGTFRYRGPAGEYANWAGVATFGNHAVVADGSCVKIDNSIPLDVAALTSCGVLTGWGAAVRAGETQPGETVVIFGAGGVGINAVIGAAHAGAGHVLVVDPIATKRAFALEVGATHAFVTAEEAKQAAADLNPSAGGADLAIVTASELSAEIVRAAFDAAGKRGRVVIASITGGLDELRIPGMALVNNEKRLIGTSYGSCNPHSDIPLVLELAQSGRLPLARLISARYPLDEISAGFADLVAGRNIRGIIEHEGVRARP